MQSTAPRSEALREVKAASAPSAKFDLPQWHESRFAESARTQGTVQSAMQPFRKSKVRLPVACLGAGLVLMLSWTDAVAQAPSAATTSLVVPYPPGGVSDVLARSIAPALAGALRRPVVVENVSGASGSIGAARVLANAADGSHILVGSATETVLAPVTIRSPKYGAADFRLLAIVYFAPLALYAKPDLDARSVDDLARLARRAGSRPLTYGSPGTGSLYHIVTEKLRAMLGIQAVHVPYRGGAPMLQDLVAGTIDFTLLPQDNVLGAMVDSGKLRMIGVTAEHRSARRAEVPTFDESTSARGFGHPSAWVGLFVSKAVPHPIAEQLHRTLSQVLAQAQTRQALESTGGSVPEVMSLPEADAFYAQEVRNLQDLAKSANVQPN